MSGQICQYEGTTEPVSKRCDVYLNSFCFQGKLVDGKVFDSSLSRDTLLVELGKRTVIAGH